MKTNFIIQAFEKYLHENDKSIEEISNLQEASTGLNIVIEETYMDLQKYKKNGKASKFYIEKQKSHIAKLADIQDTLQFLSFHDYLLRIHSEIVRLMQKDPFLNAFKINLELLKGGVNYGTIEIPATL